MSDSDIGKRFGEKLEEHQRKKAEQAYQKALKYGDEELPLLDGQFSAWTPPPLPKELREDIEPSDLAACGEEKTFHKQQTDEEGGESANAD